MLLLLAPIIPLLLKLVTVGGLPVGPEYDVEFESG